MEAYASVLHGVCEPLLWWFILAEFLERWPHVGAGGTPAGPLSTPPQVSSQSSPGWLVLLLVNLCSESNTACSGCARFLQVLLRCVDGGHWDVFASSVGVTVTVTHVKPLGSGVAFTQPAAWCFWSL